MCVCVGVCVGCGLYGVIGVVNVTYCFLERGCVKY
jgi:hypothetical protein